MTNQDYTRKRSANLPRVTEEKRDYMHHKAKTSKKKLVEYIEDTLAPDAEVRAWKRARNMQDDQHNQDSNE